MVRQNLYRVTKGLTSTKTLIFTLEQARAGLINYFRSKYENKAKNIFKISNLNSKKLSQKNLYRVTNGLKYRETLLLCIRLGLSGVKKIFRTKYEFQTQKIIKIKNSNLMSCPKKKYFLSPKG